MFARRFRWILPALLLVSAASQAAEVTIYRCTDERGRLTLRDSPCLKGERQQTRTMLRPRDPPSRAITRAPAEAPRAADIATTRIVVVNPPRQLYECVAPDGATYLSESGQGELRWQQGWAFPLHLPRHLHHRRGFPEVARPRTLDGRVQPGLVFGNVGRPTTKPPGDRPAVPSPPSHPRPPVHTAVIADGAWIRDLCYPMARDEVCARLRDRRFELDRRYNSALQSERAQISREQRDIDARMASDCGGNY